MSYNTHPLKIPEIIRLVGRYLDNSSAIAALTVNGGFHSQIAATAWETIVVDLTNKVLYREFPSHEDEEGLRLLPWKSLKSYASHVRTIKVISGYDHPPTSYPRPASVVDLLTMLRELPNLRCMTLNILAVEPTDLRQLFEICSRVKSLDFRRCQRRIQGPASFNVISNSNREWEALAHKSTYDLEELSFWSSCRIGLSGILSRCPRLRVLSIYCNDWESVEVEEQIMNDLVKSFKTEGIMASLQHLNVRVFSSKNDTISKVLGSVRCLRKFDCRRLDAFLSIPDFQPHFSTLTTIRVLSGGKPEFWQKVMSSCPALLKASNVVLFAEDIIGGKGWASTGLESLDIHVFVRSKGNVRSSREAQEIALFQRIAKLEKLKKLSVMTGWREERTLRDESWEVLLRIKTLTYVILGNELTDYDDKDDVLTRFSEKQMELSWVKSQAFKLSD